MTVNDLIFKIPHIISVPISLLSLQVIYLHLNRDFVGNASNQMNKNPSDRVSSTLALA